MFNKMVIDSLREWAELRPKGDQGRAIVLDAIRIAQANATIHESGCNNLTSLVSESIGCDEMVVASALREASRYKDNRLREPYPKISPIIE